MTGNPPIGSHWARNGGQPRIAVIGAGMSGIGAVIKLEKAGYTDVTVFEKTGEIGGTWRENRYPGLSCDVPSYFYQYTFAPNPDWSHRFSYGPEIQAYLKRTAEQFGVMPRIRFNAPVTELRYEAPRWHLRAGDGEAEVFDPVGCPACVGTGYRGRLALVEALWVDEAVADALEAGASEERLRRLSAERGGRVLSADARDKVLAGQTSVAEALRVRI